MGTVLAMDFAKTARNLAVADVALAFARDRLAAQLPGVKPRRRRPGRKALAARGRRDRSGRGRPAQAREGHRAAPGPQRRAGSPGAGLHAAAGLQLRRGWSGCEHRDRGPGAAGLRGADDRRSRRGGRRRGRGRQHRRHRLRLRRSRRASSPTPEEAPLAEAGEGEAEGQEQTDLELREAAESRDEGLSPEQAQIDEAIDQAANPLASEQVEPGKPADDSEWRTWSGRVEPVASAMLRLREHLEREPALHRRT